ncbi:peptidase M24, structural domain-containing protein [Catenaria anguillulae PL171]|uniref:Peptidase M24, structural domain-containing protein n=1 Tax=Catenaria anguillulae PL171 TaxID=765915 RepID=A0A1Y2H8D7_9FUNG|nr:peptidase M24, structural domain-containing protein [Catenaria anguillulae PL171]
MTASTLSPTAPLPAAMFAAHRTKIFDALSTLGITSGLAYLRGDITKERHNTDAELAFRQESNFFYATGVDLPGYHAVLDIAARSARVFAPEIHADEAVWIGAAPSVKSQEAQFGVPVAYTTSLGDYFKSVGAAASVVHVLEHETDTSALPAEFAGKVDRTYLSDALILARMYKTEQELEVMKRANDISSEAHTKVMMATHPNTSEYALEAEFRYSCHTQGAKAQAYLPIVGVGANAAILHYGRNTASLGGSSLSPHALVLVDAGCDVHNYASDITRTFPATGKFTPEARAVYQAVLDSQLAVIDQLKPGVRWEDMHRVTERVLATHLRDKMGILKPAYSVDEHLAAHAQAVFFPHGLGHLLGLDVHDVGGYPKGVPRIQEPSIRYLRMRRTLEPGMVVTVEPGLYFVPLLIDAAKQDPKLKDMIDFDKVAQYLPVGGVRIEDNVVITETGHRNLTTVIKSVEDIEAVMARGAAARM